MNTEQKQFTPRISLSTIRWKADASSLASAGASEMPSAKRRPTPTRTQTGTRVLGKAVALLAASLVLSACAGVNVSGSEAGGAARADAGADSGSVGVHMSTGMDAGTSVGRPATTTSAMLQRHPVESRTSGLAGSAESALARSELLARAEEAYQAQQWDQALELFHQAVDGHRADPHAFLRIGNIHHRERDWLSALNAYGQAARSLAPAPQAARLLRTKALYNVTLVGIEVVQAGLNGLHALESSASEDPAEARALADAIEELAAETGRIAASWSPGEQQVSPSQPSSPVAQEADRVAPDPAQLPLTVEYFRGQPLVKDALQP